MTSTPKSIDGGVVAIIFDFDGTMVDSFSVALATFEAVTRRPIRMHTDAARLRGLNLWQILRVLNVPLWRLPYALRSVRRAMGEHMDKVELIPGIETVIKLLARDYPLYILSANSSLNLQAFLRYHHIEQYFRGVYGDASPFGKARSLRKIVKTNNFDGQRVWYVADEAWDIRAAHRAGIRAVAVSWGFNTPKLLRRPHPERIVSRPDELSALFTESAKEPS